MSEEERYVLAVDPGNTTGFCILTYDGQIKAQGQRQWDDFTDMLATLRWPITVVVVEDFRVYKKHVNHFINSRMETVKVIGSLEVWAKMKGIPLVRQDADLLPQIKKITQVDPDKMGPHQSTHWAFALIHGLYWLIKNKHMLSPLEEEAQNGR